MPVPPTHYVYGQRLLPPFPQGMALALCWLGGFWGAERVFWQQPSVYSTMVGYAGGITPHPTNREVCSGLTGHNEVVRVVYDPQRIDYEDLLTLFFESHDPTQGMRQGNDVGTQYRSGIYTYDEAQRRAALTALADYQRARDEAGRGRITSEVIDAPEFYYAEEYHQQYLAKNPDGYCGLGGTGIAWPRPAARLAGCAHRRCCRARDGDDVGGAPVRSLQSCSERESRPCPSPERRGCACSGMQKMEGSREPRAERFMSASTSRPTAPFPARIPCSVSVPRPFSKTRPWSQPSPPISRPCRAPTAIRAPCTGGTTSRRHGNHPAATRVRRPT